MAVTVVFDMDGCTQGQYEQVIKGLDDAGQGAPDGRLVHVASAREGGWLVVDVWESEEQLGNFAETLMPLLAAAGLGGTEPRVLPTHSFVRG